MIELRGIEHRYEKDLVLSLPHFSVDSGGHALVLGLSGSGKSTLLHIMGGLLRPTAGSVTVAGVDMSSLKGHQLDRFRGKHIGIVFQQMHLLGSLTVEENIRLASYLAGKPQDDARIREVLTELDLFDKAKSYPNTLSQGQKQRVCIARAVINKPELILADEPTSSLDDVRSENVLRLLVKQAESYGATLVIATHDQRIKPHFENQLVLDDPVNVTQSAVEEAISR
ncbi:MAG: ABC transporter ATP-binding protein [Rhodothermaceae bacterium]|nr:ABC transporter ATP-binding protein [Rhodothermaceae bacterium]